MENYDGNAASDSGVKKVHERSRAAVVDVRGPAGRGKGVYAEVKGQQMLAFSCRLQIPNIGTVYLHYCLLD